MIVEELLKPRIKVIAGYPDTKFKEGEIFIQNPNGSWSDLSRQWSSTMMPKFENYPHLFKKLDWWEDRKPEEMPEYIKYKDEEFGIVVLKVGGWIIDNDYTRPEEFGVFGFLRQIQYFPATKEDYENYNQKYD